MGDSMKPKIGDRCTMNVHTIMGEKPSGIITFVGLEKDPIIKFQKYGVFRDERQGAVLCCRHELTVHRRKL